MDQEQLKQKIAEYFVKLPKEAQEFFSSMNWLKVLEDIEKSYSLNGKQVELLGTETTLVLLGITHIEEYQSILEDKLDVSDEILDKIKIEIDGKILKPVKDQLVNTYESNVASLGNEDGGKQNGTPQAIGAPVGVKNIPSDIPVPPYRKPVVNVQTSVPPVNLPTANTVNAPKIEIKQTIPEAKSNSSFVVSTIDGLSQAKKVEPLIREVKPEVKVEAPKPIEIKQEPVIEKPKVEITPVQSDPKPIVPSYMSAMEEKMKGPTASSNTVSDYSKVEKLPPINTSTPNQGTPSHDPYREAVE